MAQKKDYNSNLVEFLRSFGAINFNKSNDYGKITGSEALAFPSMTISIQTKFTTTNNLVVFEKASDNTSVLCQTGNDFTKGGTASNSLDLRGRLLFSLGTSSGQALQSTQVGYTAVINDNNWHESVYVADSASSVQRTFTDGDIASSVPMNTIPAANSNEWNVGARATGSIGYTGEMAELAVYDRAKSAGFIKKQKSLLKRYLQSRAEKPEGLVAYFPNTPIAVNDKDWTHEWTDVVYGYVMRIYNNPSITSYSR
ncbi:LamG-like jellyroll fold domain-containing protein [Pontibacter rugosus]|uniref:LamG-like jellyroll fold domain-containing protein n=1 Tax=Pontibacter rugosus TaxID=1745966 RepID=A0ABW3SJZ6_9BACT